MTKEEAEAIAEVLDEECEDYSLREDYSGRGMYGGKTYAFVVEDTGVITWAAGKAGLSYAGGYRVDNMGLEYVVY